MSSRAGKDDTIGLVPGDAESASGELEVRLRDGPDGGFDCTGPSVFGTSGVRRLGLRWVTVGDDGSPFVFRGAKLCPNDLDPNPSRRAVAQGRRLAASLGVTAEQAWPRCAGVRSPIVTGSVS